MTLQILEDMSSERGKGGEKHKSGIPPGVLCSKLAWCPQYQSRRLYRLRNVPRWGTTENQRITYSFGERKNLSGEISERQKLFFENRVLLIMRSVRFGLSL
ncbi:hypothetical protein CDAR_74161 [Caerostris darwini]|uniref:Uncharacterized protein n=1 Tax=Caerostris darwini TaxID=1538125 RepID=A0AAV4Q858_9ARAC|nr:hypothetical protein CDAR_74161 [Caerostris darwini]